MTEKSHEMSEVETQDIKTINKKCLFQKTIVQLNALTSILHDNSEEGMMEEASQDGLNALNAEGGLQEMLAAQMLSIHQLQQQTVILANRARQLENIRYFTNTAIKLANCFTQQASTLNRLQGNFSQKITVEHVEVHDGGQAIVGSVNARAPGDEVKK